MTYDINIVEDLTNFEFIWEKWVEHVADKLQAKMDEEFCEECKVKKRDLTAIKDEAEAYFKERRKELKLTFYGEAPKDDTDRKRRKMDFHKLSALLCRTLMEFKVFEFDIDACEEMIKTIRKTETDWLVSNALINFRVAFYVSVNFLYQSMLYECSKEYAEERGIKYSVEDADFHKYLETRKKLNLYDDVSEGKNENRVHESFENCMVLDLAKRDVNNKSFDFLMYATIMYQLEEYNKLLYKSQKSN